MTRVLSLLRHDATWLRREPAPLVTVLLTPCLLMLFIKPLYSGALSQLGYGDADGAQLAVPGMTGMFSFFMTGLVTESYFREHGLHTWQRLRLSPLRTWELLVGKAALCAALVVGQCVFLFVLGWAVIGLRVHGSLLALLVVMVALAVCVVSFALALCAVSPTRRQAFAVERMVTLSWTVFGGALVPTELMADWIGWIARFTPVYWAVGGFRKVVLDGAGVGGVLPNAGALLGFAAAFTALALWRFTMDKDRRHWA
ncbi:ABC transporter permease [Streptomyces sp. CB01881]|uniref:ABC transporter permease n=1 Tax=Streptomyces sp. CB01881 TaxID=2078691 RepID=UPI000CDC300D|nr:ABC transporter permease [Streptomyces sp. CB01881]AUY52526.1 ABC transporter permease [Streptomyces sp. CB01881]TYC70243.1 ABC transporter permease [Streptomyces sp. CB01881]